MKETVRPIVVVSKCLGFEACRYNGQMLRAELVEELRPFVEFVPVCPEQAIGLGVPRDPIRVIQTAAGRQLYQPATERTVTAEMERFSAEFLGGLPAVDGFILKGRSPSCGTRDVKAYVDTSPMTTNERVAGFFGGAAMARFPSLPVEDEGRLTNFKLRELFLTRIFVQARFRAIKAGGMKDLVRFQAENKYLLLAHNQSKMRELGRIVANLEHRPLAEVWAAYEETLAQALSRMPRCPSSINVLQHAFGYVSEHLTPQERTFFLDSLEQFRAGRIPLSAVVQVVKAWAVRFQVRYLLDQSFFEPYPAALVSVTDSGKGRAC